VLGAVAVLRDITAIKKLDAAKSTFVSLVAHEVKRPLGIIEGYLDVVLSGLTKDPDKTRDMMQKALVRARTLRVMVTELLNLTAMETGRFSLTRAPLDLRAVAAEVVESYAERAAEKRIELRLEPSDANGSARVLADRGAMTNVIGNLVDNAIKYTPQGGHVRVRVACGPDGVQATVQDDGVGISPADRDRLFEEFFRARNAAVAEVPGTGLGLAVVKRLVDLHDGKVAVQTAEGRGSAFTVTLPLLDAGVGD
jgi:signal transduction histidine kinase